MARRSSAKGFDTCVRLLARGERDKERDAQGTTVCSGGTFLCVIMWLVPFCQGKEESSRR